MQTLRREPWLIITVAGGEKFESRARYRTLSMGFRLNTGFDPLYSRLGTTSNYSATANRHDSQITTAYAKSFPACCVFTSRYLVTVSNSGDSSASALKSSLNGGSLPTALFFTVKVKVTLRLTVSQSVSKSWGEAPDIYYCLTVTVLFFVGCRLWREDGSVFCTCYWPLRAQSFSGPSSSVLTTIFYCLRFETSPFRRLLRLAGSWWKYSTPPPHGSLTYLPL
jgi:hypothetical protein